MPGWWRRLFGRGKDKPKHGGHAAGGHGGCEQHVPTPEEDIEIARRVLAAGEIPHALHHLACALAADPFRREWLDLMDEWIAAAGVDPLQWFTTANDRYFAEEAARAYVLAHQGNFGEALKLLAAVVAAKPDVQYFEAWALDWLDSDGALAQVEPDTMGQLVARFTVKCPEFDEMPADLEGWAGRTLALWDAFQKGREMNIYHRMFHAALVRKLGRFDEALALARRAYADEPCWASAIAVAMALRHGRNAAEAIAMLETALKYDPSDLSGRCDIADTYLDMGDWASALKWYEDVLARQPNHPWATPSAAFCRYKLTGDDRWFERLQAMTKDEAMAPAASRHLDTFFPYYGYLPEPGDASANVLREVLKSVREKGEDPPSGPAKLTVNYLESPSNLLALECQMRAFGSDCRWEVCSEKVPSPDPRRPLGPVDYLLWDYEERVPRPGLPPPSAEMQRIVAALARQPYHYRRNWQAARRAAAALGVERLDEVLAVMVHPPPLEGDVTALVWVPRVQLVAARIVAHIDDGWSGSLRRKVLLDVARGPRDWTTDAAIIALAQLAQELPAALGDVRRVYNDLLANVPREGHCGYLHALIWNWRLLPGLSDDERAQLSRLLEDYNRSVG